MATWMVHFRIAEALLGLIPDLDVPQFTVGNIGPDSGLPDAKWETFTPPSAVTHFKAPAESAYKFADLDFYRRYLRRDLAPHATPPSDPQRYAFQLGYFCHLIADNLWQVHVGNPTRKRFQEQFAAAPDFIWEVKKDWYGLDFVYARAHRESLYWRVFLRCTNPINYLEDVLLSEGLQQQVRYIQAYYQRTDPEIESLVTRERVYLTAAAMDEFVTMTTHRIHTLYQHLQTTEVAGLSSTPPYSAPPYSAPPYSAPPYSAPPYSALELTDAL